MEFNIEEHKLKVKPYTDKLITFLKTKGIEFTPTDGELNNVIFKSKDMEVKISHHSFYGVGRMGAVTKQRGEKVNEFEFVPVTHEFFIGNVMKSIIDYRFNPPPAKK